MVYKLSEDFKEFGYWFLPENPSDKVPGHIIFSSDSEALPRLELEDHFSELKDRIDQDFKDKVMLTDRDIIKHKVEIIHGHFSNRTDITLYKCFGRVSHLFSPKYQVEYIFIGELIQNLENIKLNSVRVFYSFISEWMGVSSFKVTDLKLDSVIHDELQEFTIQYNSPPDVLLSNHKKSKLSILFPQPPTLALIPPPQLFDRVNIQQFALLKIEVSEQTLEDYIKIIFDFRDFLSFAVKRTSQIISVKGIFEIEKKLGDDSTFQVYSILQPELKSKSEEIKNIPTPIDIIFVPSINPSAKDTEIDLRKILFTFEDIQEQSNLILKNWFEKKEQLKSVFDLYFITLHTPDLYIHYVFINLIQALEAYYRTLGVEGKYQSDDEYRNNLYQSFLKVVNQEYGDRLAKEFKDKLKGSLKYMNEYSLRKILKEIIRKLDPVLPADFIGNNSERKIFASKVTDFRNSLTHHGEDSSKIMRNLTQLQQLTYTLKIILYGCLLMELGFATETIQKILNRQRDMELEWRKTEKN
jgi:hypothetical protein